MRLHDSEYSLWWWNYTVVKVQGKKEFIWVGPKVNLNKSHNGAARVQRAGGLSSLHLTTQTAQGPLSLLENSFSFSSSFGSSATMQVLVWLWQVEFAPFAVRMSVVCRREKWPNGRRLFSGPKEIQYKIAKRMKWSPSVIRESFLCIEIVLRSFLLSTDAVHIPHHSLQRKALASDENAERRYEGLMSRSGQKV